MSKPRLSGRREDARRNDAAILASARKVFIAGPEAPVSAVAEQAGVGISSRYDRGSHFSPHDARPKEPFVHRFERCEVRPCAGV